MSAAHSHKTIFNVFITQQILCWKNCTVQGKCYKTFGTFELQFTSAFSSVNRNEPVQGSQLCMYAVLLCCYEAKLPNLKLKTRPKQLSGSHSSAIALPVIVALLALATLGDETTSPNWCFSVLGIQFKYRHCHSHKCNPKNSTNISEVGYSAELFQRI